jgi:hypothetical protein
VHLVGGLPIEIEPEEALIPDERKALARISRYGVGAGERALPFRLRLVAEPPGNSADPVLFEDGGPAAIDWVDDRVRVSHARFLAELDPIARLGRLFRRSPGAGGLEITLRTVLCSRLPFEGGVPLHAAGIVADGRGIALFGVSGAGKSTLAGLSPHPVLSDELVAVVADHSGTGPAPFALTASGFWGTGEQDRTSRKPWPLAALVELAKGVAFRLDRLEPREAIARLVRVIMVPPGPPLWSAALAVLGRLVREVPVYRMAWSPQQPPWADLLEELSRLPPGTGCR